MAELPVTDAAGPRTGQRAVDDLVALLDLEQIEVDIFRGRSPAVSLQRVFGGQVAGQALVAAGRTVPAERPVHSLHAYFLRAGDPAVPIVYQVDRIRDGRSFTSRRVVAIQHGTAIFSLSASFHRREDGVVHGDPMPQTPPPEQLATITERLAAIGTPGTERARLPQPIDLRYVTPPSWELPGEDGALGDNLVWMRTAGVLPDDPLLHVCALTFASDLTLLEAVLVRHALWFGMPGLSAASLDHAMWFHRSFRADEWLLYDSRSPAAGGARGLAFGRIFNRGGELVVTVMQEGLLRT